MAHYLYFHHLSPNFSGVSVYYIFLDDNNFLEMLPAQQEREFQSGTYLGIGELLLFAIAASKHNFILYYLIVLKTI